jgi:hypothetical protein
MLRRTQHQTGRATCGRCNALLAHHRRRVENVDAAQRCTWVVLNFYDAASVLDDHSSTETVLVNGLQEKLRPQIQWKVLDSVNFSGGSASTATYSFEITTPKSASAPNAEGSPEPGRYGQPCAARRHGSMQADGANTQALETGSPPSVRVFG